MTIVFWDIDGTLLTTARAGVIALEDACRDLTGRALDLQAIKSDGLTDHQLAYRILEQAGTTPSDALVQRFIERYEALLPARLSLRQGRVLGNVDGVLAHLRAHRPDVHSMLLTGNTAAGARAKLSHYGLQEFFEGGAFSEDTGPRAHIAARALTDVGRRFPGMTIEPGRVFVVGDTSHDVDCAHAIGARAIAVASGVYSMSELEARGAWAVLERLPSPAAFEALIDLPVGTNPV